MQSPVGRWWAPRLFALGYMRQSVAGEAPVDGAVVKQTLKRPAEPGGGWCAQPPASAAGLSIACSTPSAVFDLLAFRPPGRPPVQPNSEACVSRVRRP